MNEDVFSHGVATPPTCKLRWDHIGADQKEWFCAHCDRKVHNLSAMTPREASKLMRRKPEGRRCVSFLHDARGRVIFRKPTPGFKERLARGIDDREPAHWLELEELQKKLER